MQRDVAGKLYKRPLKIFTPFMRLLAQLVWMGLPL